MATDYEAICKRLGFDAASRFVKVTTRGTIGFTCGKPDEIRALLAAARREGLSPSKALVEAARR